MDLKQEAARRALCYVRNGMVLGLGTGSTTAYFVDMLGERLRTGALVDVVAVPTSEDTATRARALGIPLASLAEHSRLDLAVDGADEVDPDLNLIKGLGRALLGLYPDAHRVLAEANHFTRDPRMVERKKYGRHGARRGHQWGKR